MINIREYFTVLDDISKVQRDVALLSWRNNVNKIYSDTELDVGATVRKYWTVQNCSGQAVHERLRQAHRAVTIGQHIKKVLDDAEIERGATIKKYFIVQSEGERLVERESKEIA